MLEQEPIPPAPAAPPTAPDAAPAAIRELLERARARQRRILLGAAALAAVAALVVLALPLFALAASGSALARPLALLAALASVAGAIGFALVRARREVRDLPATARLLSERVGSPALRRGLLPAYELAEELERASEVGFSKELARAHIASVAPSARTADLSTALPDRPIRLAARALLAAAALFLIVAVLFTEPIARGAKLLVLGPKERAPTLAKRAEPVTGEIELTYSYPAYTRLPARTVPNTNGEIAAPRGTQVRIKTRADREVDQAFVVVGEAALPLQVEGKRDLAGTVLVSDPGAYRFRFLDKRGRKLVEGPPIAIAVEEDGAPKATIVAPMGDVEVDPKAQVKVLFDAEDDYGVSEIALVYKLPGATKTQRVVLQRAADSPRRGSGEYSWDLLAPGLMPGDTVAYYLEATDNDEVSGRKTGVSKTQYLKIFSQAEHHRKMLQRVEQTWEKLVVLLADRLESPDRKAEGRSADKILAQAPTDTRALEIARELRELAAALRKEKSPAGLVQALEHAGTGLTSKASATADARTGLSLWLRRGIGMDSEPVRRLMRALEAEIAEEERDVLYLEALVDRQKIEDLVALSKELSAKRRDLAGLLEKYRNAPDDTTRDLLVREIARLKERMAQLMERMAELSKGIQDEHVNAEALKEMGKTQEMMSGFDKIQELLYQGKVEEAMKEMEKLGQALDSLEKNLQKAAKGQNGGEPDPMAKDLGDFARNLDQLEADQQRLLEDTQRVKNNYKKALQERLAQKGADFIERLRQKTDEARKRLQGVENPRGLYTADDLKNAKESIEDLDKALAVKDFDQAEASAAKALAESDQLAEALERRAADLRRHPQGFEKEAEEAQKNARNARAALPPLAEVKKELESLQPPPNQALSEQDRQKMKDFAQRQGQLQDQAGQLQQKMDELNRQAPMFPDEAQQMMQQAQSRMSRAQGQMQARNPSGAGAEQRAALDQLGELKKGLQRQQGEGQGQGSPVPWPWMGPGQQGGGQENGTGHVQNDQKVEIPNADQYQVPEEYRKDILDAMKQGAPEKYKDQVKRYYEEIVK